jgi:hypothetical protein
MNMYLGNNPKNTTGGIDWAKDAELKLYSADEISEMEYLELYKKETVKFIRMYPKNFFYLAWLKFKRFWNIIPNAEIYNSGLYKYIAFLTFGPVLLLSLISIIFSRRYFYKLLPIYILIGYMTLIHCFTIASLRYRLPIEPFLIILASWGFSNIIRFKKVCCHD